MIIDYPPAERSRRTPRAGAGEIVLEGEPSEVGSIHTLAPSRGIVEAHGGRTWVENLGSDEVNFPGSDFHVLLPLPERVPGEEPKSSEAVRWTI